MQWNNQARYTFQSAIKPTGAPLTNWSTVDNNIHHLSQERTQIRTILNEGQTYGQRDRVITIDGVKQRRPPRNFPTLYQLAAKAYKGWAEDEEPTTGYQTCFEFLMSTQPQYEPELILQVRHAKKWVAECSRAGEETYQVYSPYEYRVAYVKPHIKTLKKRSIYLIKLEPENEFRSYPVYMTQGIPVAYKVTQAWGQEWMSYQTDFKEDEEHCPLYERLCALHEWCVKYDLAPLHIEMFWFPDWCLSEEIIKMIPPFHNIRKVYKTHPQGQSMQFMDEIMPEFPSNGNFSAPPYTFPNDYVSYPIMFQTRPWICLPEAPESESDEDTSEENQDTLEVKPKQEPKPKPNMFDYMSERIPTDNEIGLLFQARIKRMLVESSTSWRHQELVHCQQREMEWIDHRNPYEGRDGSDLEEDDQNEIASVDNDSIDSLFEGDDEDNKTAKRPRL